MARLTQAQILGLAEPIEKVYADTVDALLLNISRHLKSGKALTTAEWELQKLAEMGQLNRESIEIIGHYLSDTPEMIHTALEGVVIDATRDVEPQLKRAVEKGAIEPAAADNVLASQSIQQSLQAFDLQATEKLNLVNTTMLQSTLEQYRKVIANASSIERQLQAAQQVLNDAAAKVVFGVETRQEALRKAISQLNEEGLTGFIDKAGRHWSPEAYVNMDIRTTVHNTAIEAVKIRQEDYGVDIFQVSRHAGARPLCYPYQGKFYTWGNRGGTFTDGDGRRHRYAPISSTSYGKPAGLFGINCGHYPLVVIPGVTIPSDAHGEDKAENDRIYAESQQQRALERDVRYAKRKAAMMEAAGDVEGFEQAAQQVKQKQANYNAFCRETGRKRRVDRTQVLGYNRSVSSKATAAAGRREKLLSSLKSAPVRLPDGSFSKIAEGATLSDLETFAGKGAKAELRVKDFLVQNYGGVAEEWQHSKARSYVDTPDGPRKAVIHWFYEKSVGAKEVFVKGWSKK